MTIVYSIYGSAIKPILVSNNWFTYIDVDIP